MKDGKTLSQLAVEIKRQQASKRDLVADTRLLRMGDDLTLTAKGLDETLTIRDTAHRQIAETTGIPGKYYDRCRAESRPLLARQVNHWFDATPQTRMVRTLDGSARALLSDRYQRIDNADVAGVVLPVLADEGARANLQIVSCEITESKLYLKATSDRIRGEVKKGDVVQAGLMITNSEIGLGAVSVQPLFFRLVCLNGMVVPDSRFRKHHVGGRIDQADETARWLSDEALRADDKAILLKIRDVVRMALREEVVEGWLSKMRDTTERKLEGDVARGIEILGDTVGLGVGERAGVLRHLIEGGDLSQWGVANAVTRLAQDVESYDRSTELEEAGGKIITLKASEWKRIAEAEIPTAKAA